MLDNNMGHSASTTLTVLEFSPNNELPLSAQVDEAERDKELLSDDTPALSRTKL